MIKVLNSIDDLRVMSTGAHIKEFCHGNFITPSFYVSAS